MIGHIFRKDARLLYPQALLVAAIHLIRALLSATLASHPELAELRVLEGVLPYVSMLGVIALTAAVVHQDPLPDTSEDFLVRPIRRGDLLGAKLLFVALIVVGPVCLADVLEGVLLGFDPWTSCGAGVADALSYFLLLSLPTMTLASVSRNLTELLAGALLLFLIDITLMLVMSVSGQRDALYGSGLEWTRSATVGVLFLIIAIVVLPAQYIRRTTSTSRSVLALGGLMGGMLLNFIPWTPSFALQQAVGARDAAPITVAYAPEIGPFRQPDSGSLPAQAPANLPNFVPLFVPLRIDGVTGDDQLLVDRVAVRFRTPSGVTVYETTFRPNSRLRQWSGASHTTPSGSLLTFAQVSVPAPVFARLQGIEANVDIDLFISVLRSHPAQILTALNGVGASDDLHCSTRPDNAGDGLEVHCVSLRKSPSCLSFYLGYGPSGSHRPAHEECHPDYAPYRLAFSAQLVQRFDSTIALSNSAGSAPSQVVIVPYEAVLHVSRHLTIASVQIANWQQISGDRRS